MSEEKTLRCPSCGAVYNAGAKTCRSCGKTLPSLERAVDESSLEGMPLSDWRTYIGKNSDYYINVFRKNKDKDIFLSFNVWAFIFRTYWFLYRKMYKAAIITYAISLACVLVFGVLSFLIQLPKINEATAAYMPYTEYRTISGETTDAYPTDENDPLKKEIDSAYRKYDDTIEDVSTVTTLMALFGALLGTLSTPFLGDWFYREHILKNTIRKKGYVANSGAGGTSLAPPVIFAIVSETVLPYISQALSLFLLFILSGV